MNQKAILCFLAALLGSISKSEGRIFCYFASWTVYRPGDGKFDVDNIDPFLCTQVSFAYVGVNSNGSLEVIDPHQANSNGLDGLNRFAALKKVNPDLQLFISIGGWNESPDKYSNILADPSLRQSFIDSAVAFLDQYQFDGIDLDWDYPSRNDASNDQDKANAILLLEDLQNTFKPKGYLISAAINGCPRFLSESYDIVQLNKFLDFINVIMFDYHGNFNNYVGHSSPLFNSSLDADSGSTDFNVAAGLEAWIQKGIDLSKVNMGLATFGRTFTLEDPFKADLYDPILDGGLPGPFTREVGVLGYNEICSYINFYTRYWDNEQQVPHLIVGDQWIGYDDIYSIVIKTQYGLQNNVGGFMVWSLDTDDFRGSCGTGQYPLINAAKYIIENGST
ncbi:chitinase-3-like protein 1 [Cylas formicarius]|uniref:chitinase-3-like protein 1 n=1 Tax=Cylas formicarius TaxID=197179 RepID=UPI0029589EA8|nr:chitinase-3-like protein 1 [Cylas formicarius]